MNARPDPPGPGAKGWRKCRYRDPAPGAALETRASVPRRLLLPAPPKGMQVAYLASPGLDVLRCPDLPAVWPVRDGP